MKLMEERMAASLPEILIEVDPVVCSSLIRAEVIVLSEEYRQVRLTEAVNAFCLMSPTMKRLSPAGEEGR